ncbi:ATP-binding protein [Myroides injenensis]|uniref:ATP-binding protein n=1 Tax=Myroides injenensis TaxID=1183151 RepID=UPI0002893568|nr:ATP-binding protein [Myroides injenensis]
MNELFIEVSPNLKNFINSFREIGYTPEIAIADIIDNSISANAKKIEIYALVNPTPIIAIIDDGWGMNKEELIEAMRLSSRGPNDIRDSKDLGKFGLGLKTASFSQCKKLTVVSKKDGEINGYQWDLDFIVDKGEWLLKTISDFESVAYFNEIRDKSAGTLVLLEEIDKIERSAFSNALFKVRNHIALVFHKFIEGSIYNRKVEMSLNNNPIKAFNPFNENHLATQNLSEEKIKINEHSFTVQPFILPHHSKLNRDEYELYGTEEGYLKTQGFYLYREHRIIIYGTWWGLHRISDGHKLIRIKIEIPNSMDEHWGIDVKKSRAKPSDVIKNELKRIIKPVLEKGSRTYKSRGRKLEDKTITRFWQIIPVNEKIRFSINEEHPLFMELFESLDQSQKERFLFYLKAVQTYLPLDAIQARMQTDPFQIDQKNILRPEEITIIANKLKEKGLTQEFINNLLKTEVFRDLKYILNE